MKNEALECWWAEWKRLTRFLHSARIALDRDRATWEALPLQQPEEAKLTIELSTNGKYSIDIKTHIRVLGDLALFSSMILLISYSHVENLGRIVSGALGAHRPQEPERDCGPIEVWGKDVLALVGQTWESVQPEQACARMVEIHIVRNAISHGIARVNQRMLNRIKNVGGMLPWAKGEEIQIGFEQVQNYRAALKSFARTIGGDKTDSLISGRSDGRRFDSAQRE